MGMQFRKTGMSMLDYIEGRAEAARRGDISLEEFTTEIRSGDRKRMNIAVERMYNAGGYENLE